MKKMLVLTLVLVMMMSMMTAYASADTLKVGMECGYAPFNWTQVSASEFTVPISSGGHADGYDVQIAKKIADGLGMELQIVKTEWDGLPMAVQTGAIDAIIAGMSPTAQRSMTIDFSVPYYESDLVVVVKKDSAYAAATKLSDLSGAKITGQLNTFHYSVIDQIEGVNKLTAMETFPAMIVALTSGAIDGYVAERPGAISDVGANQSLTYVSFDEGQGFEASPEDVAVAVGLQQGSELKAKIDEILLGISKEERIQLMDEATARRPTAE